MKTLLNDSRPVRFIVAVLAALAAVSLELLLEPVAGPAALWLCYTGGVVLGAWFGGLKPGCVTTFLLTVSALYRLTPPSRTESLPANDGWAILIFLAMALAICSAMQRLRMERLRALQAETSLRDVLENTHDIVVSVNQDLVCTYANARTARVVNRQPQQLLGRSLRTIFPEIPGSVLYRELNRVLLERTRGRFRDRVETTSRWYEFEASPAPGGINLFIRDITDRKRLEAKEKAESLNEGDVGI